MRSLIKKLAVVTAAGSLLVTPAMASAAEAQVAATSNDWVTLSELNPAGASALGASSAASSLPSVGTMSASAVAVQPADSSADYRPNPLPLPVLAVLLGVVGVMIYIAVRHDHGGHHPFLTSPQ